VRIQTFGLLGFNPSDCEVRCYGAGVDGSNAQYPRGLTAVLTQRMAEYPTVIIQGPRTVGKTTLLHSLASKAGVPIFDLDSPATRDLVTADPEFFAAGARPVLVDEYQKAPIILDAIKAELNRSSQPGQFALTGSASFYALPQVAQALTGRLHILTLYPLAQAELERTGTNIITTLFEAPEDLRAAPTSPTSREDYARRLVRGGFPLALSVSSAAARNRWFDDYVSLTLERDAIELRQIARTDRLTRLLHRLAAQTAQVLNIANAAEAVGLDKNTAGEYLKVLEALFLLYRLPAWGKTLTSRSTKSPKLHVLDSGVAARLLLLSEAKLAARDPSAVTEFGHLLETFVVGELFRHSAWLDEPLTLGHWRTHDNAEVDVVIERDDGRVAGIEVKATGRITDASFRSLREFRNALPGRFATGVILYLGQHAIRTADGLYAAPVDSLWRLGGQRHTSTST